MDETRSDVELTEDMIKAGVQKLIGYNPEVESAEYIISEIFYSMIRARKSEL